jgi:cytoskeletal protein RodZ
MDITLRALAVSVLSGALLLTAQVAEAQNQAQGNTTPPATATRPATPDQSSLPSNAPPASTTQTTGQSSQDPKVQEMNTKEKGKVEREGK